MQRGPTPAPLQARCLSTGLRDGRERRDRPGLRAMSVRTAARPRAAGRRALCVCQWTGRRDRPWKRTRNEMAVLSTCLTDFKGSVSPSGDSCKTRPIMCNSDSRRLPGYLRHGAQPERSGHPRRADAPRTGPRAFLLPGARTPRSVDCCLPMVFMGEEITIGVRAWTHGYDKYAPQASVLFHEYAQKSSRRRHVPKFWESKGARRANGQKSLRRLTSLIKMAPPDMPDDWDRTKAQAMALARQTGRSLQARAGRRVVAVGRSCQFVDSGACTGCYTTPFTRRRPRHRRRGRCHQM